MAQSAWPGSCRATATARSSSLTFLGSSEYGAAALLLAAVSMGSDFTYTPTTGTIIGTMAGLTVLTGLVNSLSTYWYAHATQIAQRTIVICDPGWRK
jgi:hypothetical protein